MNKCYEKKFWTFLVLKKGILIHNIYTSWQHSNFCMACFFLTNARNFCLVILHVGSHHVAAAAAKKKKEVNSVRGKKCWPAFCQHLLMKGVKNDSLSGQKSALGQGGGKVSGNSCWFAKLKNALLKSFFRPAFSKDFFVALSFVWQMNRTWKKCVWRVHGRVCKE